jgi:acetyl-CoA carboxylase carboxyl transferase subunit beta
VRGQHAKDGAPFTAAGKLEAGCVDVEVAEDEVPALLARYVDLLAGNGHPIPPDRLPYVVEEPADAWSSVLAARAPTRLRAGEYLDRYFCERILINGDRAGGFDPGMLCGVGWRGGRAIAFAAQAGTATSAAGFRTAHRLLDLAERLQLPVLTLLDTPGASHDAAAEREGIGTAIGELLVRVSTLRVPHTSVLIGEGGSGGALALAARGRLWVHDDAYFAVIAPESAAAILRLDADGVQSVASLLGLRPRELRSLGVARES